MADCAVLWFCNFLRLYYRLANFSLPRGTEHWNLAWPVRARATWAVQRFSRGHLEDLGDILVWLFWNIGYLLWKVGIFFLVSIVCDCDCACGFGSVPSLLRLVYTIDFNELT
jgi:hypothetical protein